MGSSPAIECHECRASNLVLNQMRAPFLYVDPISSLIHRLKYEGYFALAEPLAAQMAERWPAWSAPPDLVMPIPLHARRQRHRGYNQAALLAKPLARARGLDYDDTALRRIRHTPPQVGLGPYERASNVKDAFAATGRRLDDRHILLVDDVLTIGATMRSAAEALIAVGAASVSAYCLARVA